MVPGRAEIIMVDSVLARVRQPLWHGPLTGGRLDTTLRTSGIDSFKEKVVRRTALVAWSFLLFSIGARAQEQNDAASLARKAQNPVADMISLPFQLNWNFDTGPLEKDQEILNIQPVLPIRLNDDWNLVTRTIMPLISQPPYNSSQDRVGGMGDINFTAFFSPRKPTSGGWIWGLGPAIIMDTATNDRLGQGAWSVGPSAVFLKMPGAWVIGGLVSNVWSVSEEEGRPDVNQLLFQPFINYNFPDTPGRYLSFSPILTANWEADSGQKWTVPLGLAMGQVMKLGKQPVNLQLGAFYNVVRPDFASRWQIRFQFTLMFPK